VARDDHDRDDRGCGSPPAASSSTPDRRREVLDEDAAEDLLSALVGVDRVALEPLEVLARLPHVLPPLGAHVEEARPRLRRQAPEARPVVRPLRIDLEAPMPVIAGIHGAEGPRHEEHVARRPLADLPDDVPDGIDVVPLAEPTCHAYQDPGHEPAAARLLAAGGSRADGSGIARDADAQPVHDRVVVGAAHARSRRWAPPPSRRNRGRTDAPQVFADTRPPIQSRIGSARVRNRRNAVRLLRIRTEGFPLASSAPSRYLQFPCLFRGPSAGPRRASITQRGPSTPMPPSPGAAPGYRPRPASNQLKEIVEDSMEELVRVWDDRFRDQYGAFPARVQELLARFLECGDLHYGFVRLRCVNSNCHKKDERIVPYSCRARGLCPSCGQRRAIEWAERMVEEVLPLVPFRQLVFTIPVALRKSFLFDRSLFGDLCRVAYASTRDFMRKRAPLLARQGKAVPAMVVSPQSFSDLLVPHAHAHAAVSLGLFRRDGVYFPMEDIDFTGLEEVFRERFFRVMLRRGKMLPETVEKFKSWEHSGVCRHQCTPQLHRVFQRPSRWSPGLFAARSAASRCVAVVTLRVRRM
jgi:hypothetical protein